MPPESGSTVNAPRPRLASKYGEKEEKNEAPSIRPARPTEGGNALPTHYPADKHPFACNEMGKPARMPVKNRYASPSVTRDASAQRLDEGIMLETPAPYSIVLLYVALP